MCARPTYWIQVYRGAIRGDAAARERKLREYAAWCAEHNVGLVFHGFPRELALAWPKLAMLAKAAGCAYGYAVGLDGRKDNDGSALTVEEKADAVSTFARDPNAAFTLIDAEGQWDSDQGADDDMDLAGAERFCTRLRAKAPAAVLYDQPWFAIESHGGFPSSRFAAIVNGRLPQCYFNDFPRLGKDRPAKIWAWMERDWKTHEAWLRAKKSPALVKPRGVTLQAHGWTGIEDQAPALLRKAAATGLPVVIWSEPWPGPTMLAAIAAAASAPAPATPPP